MINASYYPGCSLEGTAKEYGSSIKSIAKLLDVCFHDLNDWNCCGASSAHAMSDVLAQSLSARNLQLAEKMGMDLIVPCASCFNRLKTAEKRLLFMHAIEPKNNIKYIVDFIWEDVGEKTIKDKIINPLRELNSVCYYGCLATRPPKITDAFNVEDPDAMDNLLKTLGSSVKNWSYKTECCGGSLVFIEPTIANKLTRKILDMAEEAGADCIVTACPLCQVNLDMGQNNINNEADKKYNLPIFYFTELMGLAFGEPLINEWIKGHYINPKSLLEQKELI